MNESERRHQEVIVELQTIANYLMLLTQMQIAETGYSYLGVWNQITSDSIERRAKLHELRSSART